MPSSVIAAMHYNSRSQTLRIKFVSGLVYDYKKVPERIFVAMKAADSKGSFLNTKIKGKYPFERIDH